MTSRFRWRDIRPAWLLVFLILVGWIIGVLGKTVDVCPPSIPSSCGYATNYLAQNNAIVVYLHQYYQIFTSTLVTDSLLDAGFNALAVMIIDWLTEDVFDKPAYFLVFFLTAILGNLLTLLQGPYYISAGASGGIFGVFAAVISFTWARDKKIEMPTLTLFVIFFFGSSILPNVNWVAHVGGALGGFIIGGVLYQIVKPHINEYSRRINSGFATSIAVFGFILLMTFASIIQFLLFAKV